MNVQAQSRFNNAHKVDLKQAAALWSQDVPASKIGSLFGVSRSAIIGLAHRNRDLFPMKEKKPSARHYQREAAKNRPPRIKAPKPPKPVNLARLAIVAAEAYDAERAYVSKPLHELSSCECHWPLNEGAPFLFCAAVVEDDQAYCSNHFLRAYRPRKAKEQA